MDKFLILGSGWMRGKFLSLPPEVRSVLLQRDGEHRSALQAIENPTDDDARQFFGMVWLTRMRFTAPEGQQDVLVPQAWGVAQAIGDFIKLTRPRGAPARAYGRSFDEATLDGLQSYYFALSIEDLRTERHERRKERIVALIDAEITRRETSPQPRAEAPKETT